MQHAPDVEDGSAVVELPTAAGSRRVLRHYHLLLALVIGAPVTDFELRALPDDEADALLERVVELVDVRTQVAR